MDISKFKEKVGSLTENSEGNNSSTSKGNFVPKDNSGRLFANGFKTKENQPDYRGDVVMNGKEYKLSGWKRKSKSGSNYISLAISEPPEDFLADTGDKKENRKENKETDSDLPF